MHGLVDMGWTATYAFESSRGLLDEKWSKYCEAFERTIEKIEEPESTWKIKFFSSLEDKIDKVSIDSEVLEPFLEFCKGPIYLDLCDELKDLASQERDYFKEKEIPNLAGKLQNCISIKLWSLII